MKLIVNGKEHEWTILHGNLVMLMYEGIAGMAGFSSLDQPTVTYRFGKEDGVLTPGQKIEVPIDQTPIFNVANTGSA